MLSPHAMTEARRNLQIESRVEVPANFIDEAIMVSHVFTAMMSADHADYRIRVKIDPGLFLDQDAVAQIDDRGAVIVISAVPVSAASGDANTRLAAMFAAAVAAYADAWNETPEGKAWRGEPCEIALARGVSNISREDVARARVRLCH